MGRVHVLLLSLSNVTKCFCSWNEWIAKRGRGTLLNVPDKRSELGMARTAVSNYVAGASSISLEGSFIFATRSQSAFQTVCM
jgi:hypothetical protein